MADLRALSDISGIGGANVRATDVIIPKAYYKILLAAYPKLIEEINAWFNWHTQAKCIVIKNFKGEEYV